MHLIGGKWYNSNIMRKLDWERVRKKYEENPLSHTKNNEEFNVSRVTDTAIYVYLPSGEEYISRENLEKAVELINQGIVLQGPIDYKMLVYDQRPTYAWAILRDMGLV